MATRFLVLSAVLFLPFSAYAQTVVLPPEDPSPENTSVQPTVILPEDSAETSTATLSVGVSALPQTYGGKLTEGNRHYVAGNFPGALAAYEEAKAMKPGDALSYYFIGCVQTKLVNHDDAIMSFRTAATIAGEKNAGHHGRALFMIAVVEEKRGKIEAAREAWVAYKGFVQTHKDVPGFVASADARLKAYDKKQELNQKYEIVRERIAGN
jgi:tetratricopeptide (TPR) repeat protein